MIMATVTYFKIIRNKQKIFDLLLCGCGCGVCATKEQMLLGFKMQFYYSLK